MKAGKFVLPIIIVLVLFGGRGKISSLMGDFGKGLKNFKKGVSSDDDERNTSSEVERIENAQNIKEDTKKDLLSFICFDRFPCE